jgi:ppGpp synthetase/RelA/SpoT-type nucleotidyltranferase
MMSDLESANEFFVGVPKGNMVSPQIQELFMLVEFVSKNQEKLKTDVENELPQITALNLKVEFLEDRLKKAEEIIDKLRNNGTHKGE